MAKSSRKASARPASKGSASSPRSSKAVSRGASASGSRRASAQGGRGPAKAVSRWSRGKPVARRAARGETPVRVAAAPLAIRDPSQEEIAHHAYLRWLKHGGTEHENWFAAEQELRTRRSTLRTRGSAKGGA